MKFNIITILAIFFIVACNDADRKVEEKSAIDSPGLINEDYSDQFLVQMKVKILKPDMVQIYYNESDDSQYVSTDFVEKWVSGTENWQVLKFVLPKGIYPTHLRLDLGRNPSAEYVLLNGISISYENKNTHTFTIDEIKTFFRPNANLNIIDENGSLRLEFINKTGKFDPYLSSNNLKGFTNKVIFGL